MIVLKDDDTGEILAIARVLQMPPDFDILGLGIYPPDHDFSRTKKPEKLLRFDAILNQTMRSLESKFLNEIGDALTKEDVKAFVDRDPAVDQIDLTGLFKEDAEIPSDDIDWESLFFPEDFEEEESVRQAPPAIFVNRPVRM